MFTEHDVRTIFSLFPPLQSSDFLPSLIQSDGRHGFVTLQFVQAQFRSRVTKDTQRIAVSALASELDVHQTLVLQLVRNHPKLALLSADSTDVIAADERDALQEKLARLLEDGLVLKSDFVTQNDLHTDSLDVLLADQKHPILILDDYAYSKPYESSISETISNLLQQSLKDVQTVDIASKDLPGAPPMVFTLHILHQVRELQKLILNFSIKENAFAISCTPTSLTESKRDTVISDLQSGTLAYLDLQTFVVDFPEIFPLYGDAYKHFENVSDVDIIERSAISRVWVKKLEEDCKRVLEQEGCSLDVREVIGTRLPQDIRSQVASRVESSITATFSQNSGFSITSVGPFLLTTTRRDAAVSELMSYATNDAQAQWAALSTNPTHDIKFSIPRIATQIPDSHHMDTYLVREKAVEKQLDEQFWTHIAHHEAQNEAEFATYWTDRVLCRLSIYNISLTHVSDDKLRDQLSTLLTAYAQQELIPDALTKAQAQNLLLSRRTRKNTSRLESVLKSAAANPTTALEKFANKQTISLPSSSTLASTRTTMADDMRRRMQKLKPADGPALFLTLVILLFAKHHDDSIVYATGKFAPKLLRLLKGTVDEEMYKKLDLWKEAAKAGTLSKVDKESMVALVAEA